MKRRIVALCLMLVMILPMIAACGEANIDGTTEPSVTTTKTTHPPPPHMLGYLYRILDFDAFPQTIESDVVTIVDKGIYRRNELVKSRFNIGITAETRSYATWWENTSIVKRLAAAERAEYDLVTLVLEHAFAEVLNGNVVAACDLPNVVDMSKPWHHQSLNDSTTVDGVPLFDFTAMDVQPGGECLIFNRDLADELNLDDPYDLVNEGVWTYDAMWQMAKTAACDLDKYPGWTEEDRCGFVSDYRQMTTLVQLGTGEFFVNLGDGAPSLNKSEELVDLLFEATEALSQEGVVSKSFDVWDTTEMFNLEGRKHFENDLSMFILGATDHLKEFGDMESDFGILPYPKKNAEQSRYYVPASSLGTISMILSCHGDIEFAALVKEALAVESLNYYYPAYYEQTAKNRYLRDERDLDMLKIITDSAVVDLGNTVWYVEIRNRIAEELYWRRGTAFEEKLDDITPYADVLIDNLMDFVNSKKN